MGNVSRGRFITLEGVDGAGKSSHIEFIADLLRRRGVEVVVTREPGGTRLAEALRALVLNEPMDPVTESLLMFAARADHVLTVIAPALAMGRWVLCDRFTDATVAYQGAGKGVDPALIRQLSAAAHPGLTPDLTLLFDCPWDVSQERLGRTRRERDRFEQEDRPYFERVREAYLELARQEPSRIRVLDASRSLEDVNNQVENSFTNI